MQRGWEGWASRLGVRPSAAAAASGQGEHASTGAASPPVEFVYGRVSADSDDEAVDIYGAICGMQGRLAL
jgi:hypothetical protein